jgi:multiple sugar transport system permease protein
MSERRNLAKGLGFISPWIVGFTVFTLIPIVMAFYLSFCDYTLLQAPVFRGSENYRQLWNNPDFLKSLGNTFYYALLFLPAAMVLSLAAALLLNTKIRGQSIYRTIIFLPSLVPLVASSVLWMWIYDARYGLINSLLMQIGVHHPPNWLSDTQLVMPSLALMGLWSVGNTVVIFLAGLQDVPTYLYEAAELDGAGSLGQLIHVTLPSISPVIFFNLIMGLIGTMQVWVPALVMTQGRPSHASYFYTYFLYDSAFTYLKMGQASAMAWIQFLIILALTGLAFWTSKHWVYYQGK